MILFRLLRNRNFILLLAFFLGLALGSGVAGYTKQLTLPALALIMTVSATQVSSGGLGPPRKLLLPILMEGNHRQLGLLPGDLHRGGPEPPGLPGTTTRERMK